MRQEHCCSFQAKVSKTQYQKPKIKKDRRVMYFSNNENESQHTTNPCGSSLIGGERGGRDGRPGKGSDEQ